MPAVLLLLLSAVFAWGSGIVQEPSRLDVKTIVARSVANNNANWNVAPDYDFRERDVIVKGGQRTVRTYEVTMIDGSPYNRVIAENGEPLSPEQTKAEDEKMQQETEKRRNETPAEREKRIARYQSERQQDHALMAEMTKAFDYKLKGTEVVNGRECYRVEATPKPGYLAPTRDTKVLTGMRGTLWIDMADSQWVKVHVHVFRPVAFGLFIAQVEPGTEFTLDEGPVGNGVWMPSHFETRVNAKMLFLFHHTSLDDEHYWDYRKTR